MALWGPASATPWRPASRVPAQQLQHRCFTGVTAARRIKNATHGTNGESPTPPRPDVMMSTPASSLLDTCRASVLDGTYDASHLEAQAQHAAAAAQLAAAQEDRYLIDPPYVQDRVDNEMYERLKSVVAKWEPHAYTDDMESHHNYGNEGRELSYIKSKKCFELLHREQLLTSPRSDRVDMYQVISSALLLYRVCCLFAAQVEVEGPEGYKVVWSAQLKHRATGERVGFSEWKGAATVSVSRRDGPADFEADMVELLNLLCDEKCPHPYDGTVAGSVA